MIESIGYTENGEVWVRLVLEINGQKGHGTLILKPEFAKQVSENLLSAAQKAEDCGA